MLDEILVTINKSDRERDTLEKLSRSAKNEYKTQKIEIENQFAMIVQMLTATQSQLLQNLEEKYQSQQQEINGNISKLLQFSKEYRSENEEINRQNITQIVDLHDRITGEWKERERYVHKSVNVVLDTTPILQNIPKIAYIEQRTKEEMSKQQEFNLHGDNRNLQVRPQLIALNTNSMNTKICVSWKLQPVRDRSALVPMPKLNGVHNAPNPVMNGDLEDVDLGADGDDDLKSNGDVSTPEMTPDVIEVDGNEHTMSVHEICKIDIQWRFSDETQSMSNGGGSGKASVWRDGDWKWNVIEVVHHELLSFNLDSSIFDHVLNTTRFGIFCFRINVYGRSTKLQSKEMSITTFKVNIRHVADEWHKERKQKEVNLGFFNTKMVTRDIPGKFRHAFGTLVVSKGVAVFTVRIKKRDPNRDHLSAMIGVINMNNRQNPERFQTLNQCFAHIGIGYGILTSNGDVYHTKQPRVFGKEIHQGDVVQIMCDYRGQTISFIVNNINWGIAFDKNSFPGGKMPHFGLAVALRGCDEIELVDFVNEAQNLFPEQRERRGSASPRGNVQRIQSGKMGKLKMKKWDKSKMASKVGKLKLKAKDKYGHLDRDEAVKKLRIQIPQIDDK